MEFWERRTFADWERNRIADFSLMSTFMNPYALSTFLFQQRKMLSRSAFQRNNWGLQLVFGSLCPNECTLSVLIILMQRGWFTFLVVAVLLSLFIVVGTFQNYSVLAPVYKTAPTMTTIKNVT